MPLARIARPLTVILVLFVLAGNVDAALITAAVTGSPAGNNYYPASQASDGNTGTTWVTQAFFPNYYAGGGPTPVLTFDLGRDTPIDAFAFWNYGTLGNRTTQFSMKFATNADGTGNFGTSIPYNPAFTVNATVDNTVRQDVPLAQQVMARYVQMTVTGNNYAAGGGGDRVGFAETQFNGLLYGDLRTGAVTSSTAATDYYPAWQASDGSTATSWVTNNPAGDYYTVGPVPVLTIDLGGDWLMDGLSFWNYPVPGNATSRFSLKFATALEGTAGFGSSISYNPTYAPTMSGPGVKQDFLFNQLVRARYVQMTLLDNYAGSGTGGDRVGFNEIQFSTIPEPSTLVLLGLGAVGLLGRFRRRRG